MNRLDPRATHLFIGQPVGSEKYPCSALNLRLDLHLPLVVHREAWLEQVVQECIRADALAQQILVAAVGGQAVGAFAGNNDAAAGFDDLRRRAHAFDGLIQVLIKRIAAVGRQHDVVGGRHAGHGCLASKGASGGMAGEQLA